MAQRNLCEQCAKALGLKVEGGGTAPGVVAKVISEAILSQAMSGAMAAAQGPAKPRATPVTTCPACGLAYAHFRQNSMLGCPHCYAAFEAQLGPLLERVHEGGTHHTGKQPKRLIAEAKARAQSAAQATPPETVPQNPPAQTTTVRARRVGRAAPTGANPAEVPPAPGSPAEVAAAIAHLRSQLGAAIAAEQYERAAQLRDQIRRLSGPPPAPPG